MALRDILFIYFHGLGWDLHSILGHTTTLDVGPTNIVAVQLRFMLGNLLQDQVGKICRLLLYLLSRLSRAENWVLVVAAGHELVEHIQIVGINLLRNC